MKNSKRVIDIIPTLMFLVTVSIMLTTSGCVSQERPGLFGIYTSSLDGKGMKLLVEDSYREVNHARVSPDKQWITFTRYNKKGLSGLAEEINGYEKSEIMLMRPDGTEMRSLVPSQDGFVAANGYWTPDSKRILFVKNGSGGGQGGLYQVELATGSVSALPAPEALYTADPHQVGDKIAFSLARDDGKGVFTSIWVMDKDGKNVRQISRPPLVPPDKKSDPPPGDFDPKLSPDGSRVVAMRHTGNYWGNVVIDLKNGTETNLSGPDPLDAVPEWSSDGKLLLFWHFSLSDPAKHGLYTSDPEGKNRRRVPLPHDYFYTMPAFFPGEGSGQDARIIFSGKKITR